MMAGAELTAQAIERTTQHIIDVSCGRGTCGGQFDKKYLEQERERLAVLRGAKHVIEPQNSHARRLRVLQGKDFLLCEGVKL